MKNKYKILIAIFLPLMFFSIFTFIFKKNLNKNSSFPPLLSNNQDVENISLTNENNESKATLEINDIKYESTINSQTTIYEFMRKLESENKINFKEKNYIGMGKFIEEINGIKSNGKKYWIYYVNNKKANIGISNYKINKGDVVSWKYESEY